MNSNWTLQYLLKLLTIYLFIFGECLVSANSIDFKTSKLWKRETPEWTRTRLFNQPTKVKTPSYSFQGLLIIFSRFCPWHLFPDLLFGPIFLNLREMPTNILHKGLHNLAKESIPLSSSKFVHCESMSHPSKIFWVLIKQLGSLKAFETILSPYLLTDHPQNLNNEVS